MAKEQVPVIVMESLKEVSQKIKEYNYSSDIKLVAKSSENYLLKIYPKNYESLYFQIGTYELYKNHEASQMLSVKFTILFNYDSFRYAAKRFPNTLGINGLQFEINKNLLLNILDYYLLDIDTLHSNVKKYENTQWNPSDFFDLENEEDIISPEPDYFELAEKILPYGLKQFSIKNFQGVKSTVIDNIPVDTQWIFLVGENGFGKTTILQAIFLGLNGAFDGNTNLVDNKESSIQIEYKSIEHSFINSIKDNKNPLANLAAYGPGRLNLQGVKSENAEDRNNSISYNLFNSDGFLFNINSELVRWGLKKDKRFNLVKRAICSLIPNLADIKLNKETDQIEYIEQEILSDGTEGVSYQPLPFQRLASGFKSTIALAGDIIVRLSKNQPTIENPQELKGIVIIDELDLHLHPKLQKQLVGNFSKVFPQIQFIVSTHSPIPLLGAPSNSLILKVTRNSEEGVQLESVKIDLKNLTPNLVLTSGIFDMEDFVSVQNEDITEVRTEDTFSEMQSNDKIEEKLKTFEESNRQFPDELFTLKSAR